MKLKYKKIILLTTMSTMGIGLLTLSISQDNPKAAEESLNPNVAQEASLLPDGDAFKVSTLADVEVTPEPTVEATPTPTPLPSPTPTPFPVYNFEEEADPAIETLFKDYYVAKNSEDVEKIKSMLSNPDKVQTKEQLQKETEFVEDYRNIKCKVKKSYEEGCYIVYVYHEVKLESVVTLVPALYSFYVITDSNGDYKIFSDEMDPILKEYYDGSLKHEDVIALKEYTDKKAKEAREKDENLKTFWDHLDNAVDAQDDSEAEEDNGE
jgi:hypothetical protein